MAREKLDFFNPFNNFFILFTSYSNLSRYITFSITEDRNKIANAQLFFSLSLHRVRTPPPILALHFFYKEPEAKIIVPSLQYRYLDTYVIPWYFYQRIAIYYI